MQIADVKNCGKPGGWSRKFDALQIAEDPGGNPTPRKKLLMKAFNYLSRHNVYVFI